eukprot:GHRR01011548.1.p1 GENE.GHRR01011548.1~~GHRR01011548.1.p1  ORF type:complete len:827 (+),score=254.22 GHRR01011548.1:335-2815(+)
MADVESNVEQSGSGGSRLRSWRGLLHRGAAAPAQDTQQAASRLLPNPFNRFSTVHEDRTSHPGGVGRSDGSQASLRHDSSSSDLIRRASGLGRSKPGTAVRNEGNTDSLQQHSSTADSVTSKNSTSSSNAKHLGGHSSISSSKRARAPPTTRALGDVVIGRPSTAVKVSEDAAKKYMYMAPKEEIEAQVASNRHLWGRGAIHPLDRRYRAWWYITVVAAAITGWLIPFRLAFEDVTYAKPQIDGATSLEILLLCIFGLDIIISFFVGYYDSQGLLVMSHKPVALHYLRHRFLLDLLTTLPFDVFLMVGLGLDQSIIAGRYWALLGLLKLGRMYRVAVMFNNMSYNLNFGLLSLTLIRNLTFSFFLLHWAACGFWYIAIQEGAHEMTWIGQENAILNGKTTAERYIFAFYWALVTFATLGYGDVVPSTTAEIVFTIIYVAVNVLVWAYILGTITLLVTKQDEETGRYRARMAALTTYCNANNLPGELKHTMAGLLRLHMSLQNETLGDEQVLAVYPTTIRRRILRQLYSMPLKECYLFDKCGVKFLDALMLGARVELFLPKVEIVSSLDHVNELYIVMAGHVELVPPSSYGQAPANSDGAGVAYRNNRAGQQPSGFGGAGAVRPTQAHPTYAGSAYEAGLVQSHKSILPHNTALSTALSAPLPSGDNARSHPIMRWLKDKRSDSWHRQQQQLQQDREMLARASQIKLAKASQIKLARASSAGTELNVALGAKQMPAYAMRKLDSRSRIPPPVVMSVTAAAGSAASATATPGDVQVSVADPAEEAAPDGNPILGPGDCFAEVAYFTEVPKAEAVRSLTVCRVLVIPRR